MGGAVVAPLSAAVKDGIFWKNEAQRAFRERDLANRSLEAVGGPVAFWRDQAKDANLKLGNATRLVGGLREAEQEQRARAIHFSEDADRLRGRLGLVKQQLWDLWSALPDADPTKEALWAVWAPLE